MRVTLLMKLLLLSGIAASHLHCIADLPELQICRVDLASMVENISAVGSLADDTGSNQQPTSQYPFSAQQYRHWYRWHRAGTGSRCMLGQIGTSWRGRNQLQCQT